METTHVSVNRWLASEDVVYMYNGIFLSYEKGWDIDSCNTWSNLEILYLVKLNQAEKD